VADEKQVEILKKGVAEWNAWRRSVHTIRPDLRGADLCGDANLSFEADLIAKLRDLGGTRVPTSADLTGAILSRADLRDAKLRDTNLMRANLSEARLSGANLTGATLLETVFADVDLTTVRAAPRPAACSKRHTSRSKPLPLRLLGCVIGVSAQYANRRQNPRHGLSFLESGPAILVLFPFQFVAMAVPLLSAF
jgi:hypothetical protein